MAGGSHLADTNILLRLSQPDSSGYTLIRAAVEQPWADGDDLCYTPQNLGEFWNVCTRPASKSGFGFSVAETNERAIEMESKLTFLPDACLCSIRFRACKFVMLDSQPQCTFAVSNTC